MNNSFEEKSQKFFYNAFNYIDKNRKTIEIVKNFEEYLTKDFKIDKPVFVCGLARSGTTPITQMLYFTDKFSSLEYKDLPFLEIPLIWNIFSKFIYGKNRKIERFHKDGLLINQNSPDAFLEVIFKNNIENYYENGFSKILKSNYKNLKLTKDLNLSLIKTMKLRKRSRYLSKINYLVCRIDYILNIFKDAKILICVRDPIDTAISLTKLHYKFIQEAKVNKYFDFNLKQLCHFEFGNNRKPLLFLNSDRTNYFWKKNQNFNGYLNEWINLYSYLIKYKSNTNILFLNYNKLTSSIDKKLDLIQDFLEINIQKDKKNILECFFKSQSNKFEIDEYIDEDLRKKASEFFYSNF